ncbi:MAG TPA: DUF3489 domain-containing protein [Devosia sp.]|jgi:hypothetical protein|uniref:DUF3489 domain-containing protein n=1 Tax=Devosia sp. TaxID=1871048 RepID=UPI002DDD5BE5|nr:DUF3489 domain-containing protein [Devosia sp.]HEV2516053.1 DUF3489 domain-containing protein [Devosia sp.]
MPSKLNDTKRSVLAGAASRTNLRVLPVPETLKVSEATVDKMVRELLGAGLVAETPAHESDVVWREADGAAVTLVITDTGLAAIGIEPGATPVETPAPDAKTSKQDAIVAMLRRPQGASIEEMTAATGWLPHSVRGWMSGAAKKRLGLELVSEKDGSGTRRYHVAALRQSAET